MVEQAEVRPAMVRGEAAARAYCGGLSHSSWWDLERRGVVKPIYVGRLKYYAFKDLDATIDALRDGALAGVA